MTNKIKWVGPSKRNTWLPVFPVQHYFPCKTAHTVHPFSILQGVKKYMRNGEAADMAQT